MNRAARLVRGRLEGARERANAVTSAQGPPGRVRRAVLRVRTAGWKGSHGAVPGERSVRLHQEVREVIRGSGGKPLQK